MQTDANSSPTIAGADGPPPSGDEALNHVIARAVWTEIHWLMPKNRTAVITVDGDDIAVAFGPPRVDRRPI